MRERTAPAFATEAELCAAFISTLPAGWTAYPEWGGWDILLVSEHGWQIGVEAKLRLNARVITQACDRSGYWTTADGPDFRAVLVPEAKELAAVCRLIGISVITVQPAERGTIYSNSHYAKGWRITPSLPKPADHPRHYDSDNWFDWCPTKRVRLPDIVPDCEAGHPAPIRLTDWKIKAIKVSIVIDKRGWVARPDFKLLGIDHRRWMEGGWLARGDIRGQFTRGKHCPDFRGQHPTNYAQLEELADKWMPLAPEIQSASICGSKIASL